MASSSSSISKDLYEQAITHEQNREYTRALILFSQLNNYEDSPSRFANILKTAPLSLDAKAWLTVGNNYFNQSQYRHAIATYRKGYQFHPNNVSLMFNTALAFERTGQIKFGQVRLSWLVIAALHGHEKSIRQLAMLCPGESPLQMASRIADDESYAKFTPYKQIAYLVSLQRCAGQLEGSEITLTPLEQSQLLFGAIEFGNNELAERLIHSGADCMRTISGGNSALHLAAAKNNEHIGRLLLAHGADPLLKNLDNKIPVHLDPTGNGFLHTIARENIDKVNLVHQALIQAEVSDPDLAAALGNLKIFISNRPYHPITFTTKQFRDEFPGLYRTMIHRCRDQAIIELFPIHASLMHPTPSFFRLGSASSSGSSPIASPPSP